MNAHSQFKPGLSLGRTIAFVGGGIGDVVMHTGHFQAIARATSSGKITVGCRTAGPISDLLLGNDFVDGVIGFGDGPDGNKVIVKTAAQKLKAGDFGAFFCLKSNPRLTTAAWLAGIPKRFGYMQAFDPRAMFLSHRVIVPKVTAHPLHMSKSDLLLQDLGLPYDHAAARLRPKDSELSKARELAGGAKLIAIGVNASVPQRQWGERFVPLIQELDRLTGANFVLFGGKDVASVASVIRAKAELPRERFVDLTEISASLAFSHAVLSLCHIYVGNDSSGLNLAVLSGLPAVGFFTLAPPLTYSPLIIPLRPEPEGSGVEGIKLDRVLATSIEAMKRYAPSLLK